MILDFSIEIQKKTYGLSPSVNSCTVKSACTPNDNLLLSWKISISNDDGDDYTNGLDESAGLTTVVVGV